MIKRTKKTIGALIILLIVAFAALLIFRIWGVTLISANNILRSGGTLLVLGLLIYCSSLFTADFT